MLTLDVEDIGTHPKIFRGCFTKTQKRIILHRLLLKNIKQIYD